MGTLFPDSDEFPDHRSVPSSVPHASKKNVAVVGLTMAVYALCQEHHDHEPHSSHEEIPDAAHPVIPWNSIGSASGNPLTPQNSSVFDTADVATRINRARRQAQTRAAGVVSTSVLFP